MRFKPTTYLISFAMFVILFLGLGVYVGYGKIADHFLAQAYLDATPLGFRVQTDAQGAFLRWEERLALPSGGFALIAASSRALPISIGYADGAQTSPGEGIPLAAQERTEDLRIDPAGRYLYARVLASSGLKSRETTWLCKYDLKRRRFQRRIAVNPLMLPAPFRP